MLNSVRASYSQSLSLADKNNLHKMWHERVSGKSDGSNNKNHVQDVYPATCVRALSTIAAGALLSETSRLLKTVSLQNTEEQRK